MILLIVIFSLEVYADKIMNGSEREIANEKTMVRMTAELSKASASDSKITKTALTNNLIRYVGTGKITVTEKSSSLLLVTFSKTGNEYEVNTSTGLTSDGIGVMAPYIPLGYTQVAGTDLDTGFVVEDSNGNQYVWVEVPKTTEVYQTAGIGITEYTEEDYEKIENDLHEYTTVYRNGTTFTDDWSSEEATGLTKTEYYKQKKKMLKSIYKNGGFYVGRYETGIDYSEGPRTSSGSTTQTPVIKQNAYPYNYVTNAQAQELAESFETSGYETSLMFGVQWDLILKYLETKGATQAELMMDSTDWGNYRNNLYNITNTEAKYSTDDGEKWLSAPYNKTSESKAILSTGASGIFEKQNIYDLAGNTWTWTLESRENMDKVGIRRGGVGYYTGSEYCANSRYWYEFVDAYYDIDFRVTLYKDEGISEDGVDEELPYLPTGYTQVAGTDLDTGLVIEDNYGNQYVWVEVPRTTTVYPTAGLSITSFTDEEYTKIENDLHTYTSVYRDGTSFTDTWSSQEATGLTEIEYYTLKKKMLKSVYQNGGFYVGKYEVGIDYSEGPRTSSGSTTQTPVIKQNAYPYNYVTNAQAQTLASSMNSGEYTTSLMFGVQWDLVLKFMETKGATQDELNSDSTSWGNYYNNQWTVSNTLAKYSTDYGSSYTSAPYTKTANGIVLLTTGASETFSMVGIYDFAGNVNEWTLEYTSDSGYPCAGRGGGCIGDGDGGPASSRFDVDFAEFSYPAVGFRAALY